MIRVNVGCGPSPTPGWINLDNSPSVRLRSLPVGRLLSPERRAVWRAAREHGIQYGSARRLPFPAASVDAIYSSHMLEHLFRDDARRFVAECRRVLVPGGTLRLAVPDLAGLTQRYAVERDADRLVASLMLVDERRGVARRLVRFAGHRWMYDTDSLTMLLVQAGFVDVRGLPAGATTISDPGALDLREREEDSLYVEARR
jgi:predicted SAM-dependent methyltransferase